MTMADYYKRMLDGEHPSMFVENYIDGLSEVDRAELFRVAQSYVDSGLCDTLGEALEGICEIDMPEWELEGNQ